MLDQHSEPTRSILQAIEDHGPISFAEYMELALYGPNGFYETPPVGEAGHFVTSPHVHPVFGRLLGDAIRACWHELGRPNPLSIVEVGAGDGTLATQVTRALADIPKRYVAIERSSGAREALRRLPAPVEVSASLEAIGQHLDGVIIANELLDNLPFRWARRDERGDLHEVLIGVEEERLVTVPRPLRINDEEALATWPDSVPPGAEGPIPEGALHFVDRVARMLHRGYAVMIDYAVERGSGIHGYRHQRVVDDVLHEPGTTDITGGVDFGVLADRAEALGLRSFGPVSQRSALLALGYERWAEDERRRQIEAQDRRSGREAALAWSSRNAAAVLVDPGGLGALRWWVVATPDMPDPGWVGEASARDLHDGEIAANTGIEGFMSFGDLRPRRLRWSRRWRMRAALRRSRRVWSPG